MKNSIQADKYIINLDRVDFIKKTIDSDRGFFVLIFIMQSRTVELDFGTEKDMLDFIEEKINK